MAAKSFEARVKALVTSLAKGGVAAVALANEAMTHFVNEGDVRKLMFLCNALPAQGCPELLKHWAKAFAPIIIDKDGVWSKDKTKDAIAFNLDGALKVTYFDYAKPKKDTPTFYSPTDFKESVASLVKRYTKYIENGHVVSDDINAINLMLGGLEGLVARNFDVVKVAKTHEDDVNNDPIVDPATNKPVDEIRIAA